jgi:hypothetical protein
VLSGGFIVVLIEILESLFELCPPNLRVLQNSKLCGP